MQSDPMQVWRTLTSHYAEMTDGELLNLAADFGDLTDIARDVLRDEMRKRGLGDPQQTEALQQNVPNEAGRQTNNPGDRPDSPEAFVWKAQLWDCGGEDEAWQICEALRSAGIESWIDNSRTYSSSLPVEAGMPLDMSGSRIRVFVAADRLEEARSVLARTNPGNTTNKANNGQEDYEAPACPTCGAADPILEGIEPSNCWRCEICGRQWSDPVEEAGEISGGQPE